MNNDDATIRSLEGMANGIAPGSATCPTIATFPSKGFAPTSKARQWVLAAAAALTAMMIGTSEPATAAGDTRSLNLYNTHTRERLTITFKKNGRYIPSALAELNRFLRDWRRNESIKMDPRLFDTVSEVYRLSGASQPIHVVCGYRSLATNNMLRSRSRGVAKHSQHTLGKAMDMFIPGVSVNKLREIGVKLQRGGVGWYPTAGSPFVHIDVGSVRTWPRMTRQQLVKLFPDGKTAHLPADGKPLPGYQQALAELKRKGSVGTVAMASADAAPRKRGLLAMLFGDEEDASEEIAASTATAPARGSRSRDDDDEAAPKQVRTKPAAAEPAPAASEPAKRKPAESAPTVAAPRPEPAPAVVVAPVVVADVPKPMPAPERPAPQLVAEFVPASGSETEAPIEVADAPIPRGKPAELMALAMLDSVPPPPLRPELAPSIAAVPARGEPVDARMALAEVANDPIAAVPDAALGYAAATAARPAPTAQKPLLRTASIGGQTLTRGLGGPTSLTPLPQSGAKTNPLADLSPAGAARDLPIYDGAQSAYWGAFATLSHPDQRKLQPLLGEPVKVVVATFAPQPYADQMVATRFTGEALPRLQVMRFSVPRDLAMR